MLDGQIDEIGRRIEGLTRRRKAADRVQEGLDLVIRRYRQANYDSDRSYFEDFDDRDETARFEDGSIDAEDLWRSIQSAQRFRPIRVEPSFQPGFPIGAGPSSGQVILGAIVDIAEAAARNASHQGFQPQAGPSFPTFPTFPSADVGSSAPSMPDLPSPPSDGGFTSGEGF